MTSTLDRLAEKSVENFKRVGGDRETALDPAMIPVFAGIILNIIKLIQDCRKDSGTAQRIVNNPTVLQRLVARRAVKDYLDDRRSFRTHGAEMTDALLKTGKEVTAEEFADLYYGT